MEEKEYVSSLILDNANRHKTMFSTLNTFMQRKPPSSLPPHDSSVTLANGYVSFFDEKFKTIHDKREAQLQLSQLIREKYD